MLVQEIEPILPSRRLRRRTAAAIGLFFLASSCVNPSEEVGGMPASSGFIPVTAESPLNPQNTTTLTTEIRPNQPPVMQETELTSTIRPNQPPVMQETELTSTTEQHTTTQPEVDQNPDRGLTKPEVEQAQALLSSLLPGDELVADGIEGPETRRRTCLVRYLEANRGLKPPSLDPLTFGELQALASFGELSSTPETNQTVFYVNPTCMMGVLGVGNRWTQVSEVAMGGDGHEQFVEGGEF